MTSSFNSTFDQNQSNANDLDLMQAHFDMLKGDVAPSHDDLICLMYDYDLDLCLASV